MKLSEIKNLLPEAAYYDFPVTNQNNVITDLSYDSRQVKPGHVFIALRGSKVDGHSFINDALQRGCLAIITRKKLELASRVPQIVVSDTRKTLAFLSHHFYDKPSHKLKVISITGTNGKTTTAYLIKSILEAAGRKTGLLGTIKYELGPRVIAAPITTPESLDLQKYLAEMVQCGMEYAVIEASSHSLVQKRVYQTRFVAGVLTNVARDHLDYHTTMKIYRKAKAILFRNLEPDAQAILNKDDRAGHYYAKLTPAHINWYSLCSRSNGKPCYFGQIREMSLRGMKLIINTPSGPLNIKSQLTGQYNAYNILAAVSTTLALGIDPAAVIQGVEALKEVRGRLEPVEVGQDYKIIVDFAHTDGALKNLLINIKNILRTESRGQAPKGRIILVFGCGGDRDIGKRPLMGEAAGRYADIFVITSDNPRSEDPLKIIADIKKGIKRRNSYYVQPDRYEAIKQALALARANDVVLIAGKGHETYQIFKDTVKPFDDREVVREILGHK
jgi:UDP-N-acetylmuramoyl-L-alanyl-D-glutamate--2,6-diaminopimelate ligase